MCLLLLSAGCLWQAAGQMVRFRTNLGDIDVILLPESAPRTVANFLNYTNRGAFNNSIIHRSVRNFIFQGGGYRWQPPTAVAIPQDPPVRNEFRVSNTRGTIAMAKLGNDPNSATNQWFFNLSNNASNLDRQNGGFTVFGRVANSEGLAVMDRIAAVPVPFPPILNPPFDEMPLINYRGGAITEQNLVLVQSITVLDPLPVIESEGVISASAFGGRAAAAPGSIIEIFGSNLAGGASRSWAAGDFNEGAAPTSLDGVTVTVGGQAAFVSFVSAGQINAQVPANVPTGGSVPVVVSRRGLSSLPVSLAIRPQVPGLLAPRAFHVNGKQYVVAVRPADGALISNGSVPDIPAAPAAPGEMLLFYGIGFGAVTPEGTPVAGRVAQGVTALVTPVQFRIGGQTAQVLYAGLAPGLVGVYQFNVTVPPGATTGDQPLEVTLGEEVLPQNLWLPVRASN